MEALDPKKNKENKALLIGFVLILALILFFFLKPAFNKKADKKDPNSSLENINIETDYISFQELQKNLRDKENIYLLDIRSLEEFQVEHIIDSKNVPVQELADVSLDAAKENWVVIVNDDTSAALSSQAAATVKNMGFQKVAVLSGGITAWKNQGGQTISWGNPNSFVDQSKVNFIDAEKLKNYIDNKNKIFIIDASDASIFLKGHIPSSSNIPFWELEKGRNEIPIDRKIIIYGETELQGFQAGVKLYDMNFSPVEVLSSGFTSWERSGFETIRN
jgi:rhodanese-related sulfurtransferase